MQSAKFKCLDMEEEMKLITLQREKLKSERLELVNKLKNSENELREAKATIEG